ncbi:MAG: esterase-like activity of phytase family protein [Planctomycetia bacterium]|nr:esterase-like activity of phytase family protein [Planctomycetia bacterium]
MSARRLSSALVHALAAALVACQPGLAADAARVPQPGLHVEYRGARALPGEAATSGGVRVPVAGLSGLAWLGDDRYVAILDNSRHVLRLRLAVAADGMPQSARDLEVVTLAEHHDFEDVAPSPADAAGVYLCEEDTPAIRAFRLTDGGAAGQVQLPAVFRTRRANRGPEALALDPDGRHLWTANEEALEVDGPPPAANLGTVVRLTRLALAPGEPTRQVAYRADPPHEFIPVAAGPVLSGVVAVVPLGEGRLLVVERSGGPGLPPFENRVYLVDVAGAPDVSQIDRGLADRHGAIVAKRLLWSGALGLNIEGMAMGPRLDGRRRALLAVADNGGLGTPSQVAGFVLSAAVTSP